jgi:hypothetical protein
LISANYSIHHGGGASAPPFFCVWDPAAAVATRGSDRSKTAPETGASGVSGILTMLDKVRLTTF